MIPDQALLHRSIVDPAAPRPEGLIDSAGRPAGRRFDVYRNNVTVSLIEALETAFPVLRKLVGDENFRHLARAFLRRHPPSSPMMMFYGDAMPDFLSEFGPTGQLGYLPDVARLELAMRRSYHAADATPLARARLEALAPEALWSARLTLAPSVLVIRSAWPLHAIWRYNIEVGAPRPKPAAEDVIVLRPDYDPVPHCLGPGAATFVDALRAGRTFGEANDAATDDAPSFDLSATLTLLLAGGAITGIGDLP